jgi:hypothetical protein
MQHHHQANTHQVLTWLSLPAGIVFHRLNSPLLFCNRLQNTGPRHFSTRGSLIRLNHQPCCQINTRQNALKVEMLPNEDPPEHTATDKSNPTVGHRFLLQPLAQNTSFLHAYKVGASQPLRTVSLAVFRS